MARLSLCMIARDEAEMLGDCLRSVEGVVDEIVLVDTGSTDATVSIAESFGARVLHRAWDDDFAAPRNEALKAATGDYVLQLDADERLATGAARTLRRVVNRADFDLAVIPLHNAGSRNAIEGQVLSGVARMGEPIYLPRLFRRTDTTVYRGVIHESVAESVAERKGKVTSLPIDIIHFGALDEMRVARNKDDRNLRLLRKRIIDEPTNIVAYGYLALELLNAGAHDEAGRVIEEGWRHIGDQPRFRSMQRLAVARAVHALASGSPQVAVETAARAAELETLGPDLLHLKGCALELLALRSNPDARLGLLEEAIGAQNAAAAFADRPVTERLVGGATSWAAHRRRAALFIMLGRPRNALSAAQAALTEIPNDLETQLLLAEAVLDCGEAARSLRLLETLLVDRPDGWLLAGAAAFLAGGRGDAAVFFAKARSHLARGFVSAHRRLRFADLARALAA
ncbi:MAG: glycosyltransferase [Myxococcota bacterium]